MTKKIPIGFALAITLLAMTATLSVTMLLAMNIFNDTVESVTEREETFAKLSEVDRLVRNNYLGEIDEQLLTDMTSTGYLSGISDEAARYFNAQQYAEYLAEQNGEIVGIGVTVANDATGYIRVIRVAIESPAAEAAIDEGSIIKSIGGTDTRGISLEVANRLLNGTLGSEVEIVWQAAGAAEDTTTTLLRRSYIVPTLEYSNQSGATGYIKVILLNETLASELDFAINSLVRGGATGLVIDLRGVSQSNISAVSRIADIFLDAEVGEIATIHYNDDTTQEIFLSNEANTDLPITMIVDSGTSGAAELLAITLRDFVGAKVVGETTAGKGGVSEIFHLTDGSAIELTVAQIAPAKSDSYADTGVPLDFEVVLTAEQKLYSYNLGFTDDPQYLKAVEMLNTLKTEAGIELTPDDTLELPDIANSESTTSQGDVEIELENDSSTSSSTSDESTSTSQSDEEGESSSTEEETQEE